jgi:hypothetical protein
MKVSTWAMCTLAIVLWVGASAPAESKDKASGDQTTVKERDAKANQGQAKVQAGDVKAGKGGQTDKQTGPQDKKAGKTPEAAGKSQSKGKGQDQKAQAFQKQLQHEQGKHMERVARLNRIREIAVQKNDAEMIARVDKLMAKEQEVYGRKLQKMQGQPRANPQLPAGPDKAEKAAGKTAAPAGAPPRGTRPPEAAGQVKTEKPAEPPK